MVCCVCQNLLMCESQWPPGVVCVLMAILPPPVGESVGMPWTCVALRVCVYVHV